MDLKNQFHSNCQEENCRSTISISVSETLLPIAAFSTEFTDPDKWAEACIKQITPHLKVPKTCQAFTIFVSTLYSLMELYPSRRSSMLPKPPTTLSVFPKRQEFPQIQPKSCNGFPI